VADFRDKKIRNLFEPGGLLANAGADDLAVAVPLIRQLFELAVHRAQITSRLTDITLDPLPAKAPSQTPKDGEAAD